MTLVYVKTRATHGIANDLALAKELAYVTRVASETRAIEISNQLSKYFLAKINYEWCCIIYPQKTKK